MLSRLSLIALALLITTPALAVEIYLNGVKVTGALKGQTFENAKVSIDAAGDVRIDAPGYKVELEGAAQAAATLQPGKYWLFFEAQMMKQYRTEVSVNGKTVLTIPPESPQYIFDIGKHATQGANKVQLTFYPVPGASKIAGADAVSILIGEGKQGADGTLTMSKVIQKLKHPSGRSAEAYPLTLTF
jgi:hypothetical protein